MPIYTILVNINKIHVFLFTRGISSTGHGGQWGGEERTTRDFTAVTAPCSSAENPMLLSGDEVIWHHCQRQNTVVLFYIWVAPSV